MSDLQRKTNYSYGITNFLLKQGFNVSGSGYKQNKIMVKFLKGKGLPYKHWNWRYKGLNTADLFNSEIIQEHWEEFKNWVLNKK